MTAPNSIMTELPPPTNPPPGWYPDPADRPGYRWWDGQAWTESITDDDALAAGAVQAPASVGAASEKPTSVFGGVGPWLSESFRLTMTRFGHMLPMILIFVLAVSLPTSFGIWYALRDTVITFDPQSGAPDVSYGGSQPWLIAVIALFPVATILSFLAKAAIIRQAAAAHAEAPEPWSDSVSAALQRAGRVISVSLGRTLIYWVATGLVTFGIVLSPVVVLLLPILVVALVIVWIRLAFVGTVAALGDGDDKPFAESWRLSGISQLPLAGRLLLLAFVSVNMILAAGLLGAPFTALAGGAGGGAQPSSETLRFNDLLGPNPSVFAIGSLFNALGLGVNYVLSAVGTTLLYRKLGGPVAAAAVQEDSDSAIPSA